MVSHDIPPSIKSHVVLAQKGEQFLLSTTDKGIVLSLIDARLHETPTLTNIKDLCHFTCREIGKSKLFELAFPISLVNGFTSLLEGGRPVRLMEIFDVDLVDPQLFKRSINVLGNFLPRVASRLAGLHLGVDNEAFPSLHCTEPWLRGTGGPRGIIPCGVDLLIPSLVECIQVCNNLVGRVISHSLVNPAVSNLEIKT